MQRFFIPEIQPEDTADLQSVHDHICSRINHYFRRSVEYPSVLPTSPNRDLFCTIQILSLATEYYTEREWQALDDRLTKLIKRYSQTNSERAYEIAQLTLGIVHAESDGGSIDEESLVETLGISREIDQLAKQKKILRKKISAEEKVFEKLSGTPAYQAVKRLRELVAAQEQRLITEKDAAEDKERALKRDIRRLENEISLLQGAVDCCESRIQLGLIYAADEPEDGDSHQYSVLSDVDSPQYQPLNSF